MSLSDALYEFKWWQKPIVCVLFAIPWAIMGFIILIGHILYKDFAAAVLMRPRFWKGKQK